jgi:hypothetical protein
VTITNVSLAGADAGSFVRYAGGCLNATLPAGGTCTVSALFRPPTTGAKTADLRLTTSDGATQAIALSGTGTVTPALTVDPTTYVWGVVPVGSSSPPQSFTITNSSSTAVTVGSITLAGTDAANFVRYAGGCTNVTLAPAATCTISALFKPLSTGRKEAQLKVNWSGGPPLSITLIGNNTRS